MCLSVTLHIVVLWQYYVCCRRSGVNRCTLFIGLFLCRICRCGLHTALWSHIGTLMRLLAAEPRSVARLLFSFQYLCGTILMTPYSMVGYWHVSRAWPMPFYWPSCLLPFSLLLVSLSLLSFYGLALYGWGLRTDWVLIAFSLSLALPTLFNNNNNNNNNINLWQCICLCVSKEVLWILNSLCWVQSAENAIVLFIQ